MNHSNHLEIHKAFTAQSAHFDSPAYHLSKQEYADYLVRMTAPAPEDDILEVAAGTCICGLDLATRARHVVCLDATPAMLETGRRKSIKADLRNMTFVKGYAEALPFLDDSFDIVISRLAFHHFTAAETPFEEMARVLRPGGKLVLVDMAPGDPALRTQVDDIERMRDNSHVRTLTQDEMAALYTAHGLSLARQETIDIPVALEQWMDLTQTPDDTRQGIRRIMEQDLASKTVSGFAPFRKDGELFFMHHWVYNIGIKGHK